MSLYIVVALVTSPVVLVLFRNYVKSTGDDIAFKVPIWQLPLYNAMEKCSFLAAGGSL